MSGSTSPRVGQSRARYNRYSGASSSNSSKLEDDNEQEGKVTMSTRVLGGLTRRWAQCSTVILFANNYIICDPLVALGDEVAVVNDKNNDNDSDIAADGFCQGAARNRRLMGTVLNSLTSSRRPTP